MVRFDNVTKIFANGYVGLDNVSFVAEPSKLTYLVGESGAGKTTILRLLLKEFTPNSGEIYVQDQALSELAAKAIPYLRRQVGVVFQDYKLIPERTVAENIALVLEILGVPKNQWKQQIESVLDLVDLEDKYSVFPLQLSGGELQRVAIARALAMTPKVLFADEPTGNLDVKTGKGIGQLLKKIADMGTTVLVATHDTHLVKNFPGNFIHLHQGKIVSQEDSSSEKSEKVPEKKKKSEKKHEDETV